MTKQQLLKRLADEQKDREKEIRKNLTAIEFYIEQAREILDEEGGKGGLESSIECILNNSLRAVETIKEHRVTAFSILALENIDESEAL